MSDTSASGKAFGRRPGAAMFAGGAVALIAASVGAGAFMLGDHGAVARTSIGDALRIELVAPVEPTPEEGEVMDVGEVTDGFVYVRAQMQPEPMAPAEDYWVEEPVYVESWDPPVRRVVEPSQAAVVYPLVQPPESVAEPDARSFGFDRPRRDFRAEREARRARLDALMERSSERRRDWADRDATSTPEDIRRSDSTFY